MTFQSEMYSYYTHTVIHCSSLTDPDNGTVSLSGTTYNSVSTYSCDSGYVLMGDDMRTCSDTGLWSGNQPTCTGNIDVCTRGCSN